MVGRIGFTIPLKTPHITSFIPQIKYVLEMIIIFCLENSITAGVDDMIADNCPEKIAENAPNVPPKSVVIIIAFQTLPALLFLCFLPRYFVRHTELQQVMVHKKSGIKFRRTGWQ